MNRKADFKDFKIRNLFINTIFEEKLRIYKAEKHGSRYVILKKEYFKRNEQGILAKVLARYRL